MRFRVMPIDLARRPALKGCGGSGRWYRALKRGRWSWTHIAMLYRTYTGRHRERRSNYRMERTGER
jgi:hypothetical protein